MLNTSPKRKECYSVRLNLYYSFHPAFVFNKSLYSNPHSLNYVSNAGTATVIVWTINFYGTCNFTKFIQLELLELSIDCSTCSRVSQFILQELRNHETKHADSYPHQLPWMFSLVITFPVNNDRPARIIMCGRTEASSTFSSPQETN